MSFEYTIKELNELIQIEKFVCAGYKIQYNKTHGIGDYAKCERINDAIKTRESRINEIKKVLKIIGECDER